MKPPRYQTIADALIARYAGSGEVLLPIQRVLAEEFGVTRVTIRQAFAWLEQRGLIQRIAGRGYAFSAGKKRPSASRTGSPRPRKVGMPLWVNSYVDLEPMRILATHRWAEAARAQLHRSGYELDVQFVGPRHEPNLALLERLSSEWSAVILQASRGDFDNFLFTETPLARVRHKVFIGRMQGGRTNCVYPDFQNSIQLAVDELILQGARRILYTGCEGDQIPHLMVRIIALEAYVNKIPGLELTFSGGGMTFEAAYSSVRAQLNQNKEFDAVLSDTSYAAAGAMRALADHDPRLLWKLPIVGLGDRYFLDYMTPRPTMVTSDGGDLGREAARMAMELCSTDRESYPNIIIPVRVIRGDITARVLENESFRHEEPSEAEVSHSISRK